MRRGSTSRTAGRRSRRCSGAWTNGIGRLDRLVNNAGLTAAGGLALAPAWDLDPAEWHRVRSATNLDGPYLCARIGRPPDARGGCGSIVNISSVHAYSPNPLTPHYDAAKAGLEGLTRSLAVALAPSGVRVNAVAPGPIDVPDSRQRPAPQAEPPGGPRSRRPARRGRGRRRLPPVRRGSYITGVDAHRRRRPAAAPRDECTRPGSRRLMKAPAPGPPGGGSS